MTQSGAAPTIDDVTVHWEEDGVPKVRELKRHVLAEHGSWATVLFLFEERGPDGWRPPKVQIRRYQKRRGGWIFHSKFILPSAGQAREAASVLLEWLEPEGP